MIKTVYDNMVDIFADDGKDLLRKSDGLRAKRITCPLGEEDQWVEVTEVLEDSAKDEEMTEEELLARLEALLA